MSESRRFKVAGMDCPECAKKIKKALKRAKPQAEAKVYFNRGGVFDYTGTPTTGQL